MILVDWSRIVKILGILIPFFVRVSSISIGGLLKMELTFEAITKSAPIFETTFIGTGFTIPPSASIFPSRITGVNILGEIADEMCLEKGITNSKYYVLKSLEFLNGFTITHVSISVECKSPMITPFVPQIKKSISDILSLYIADIGITATSGERLTSFGKGEGIQVFSIVTAVKE